MKVRLIAILLLISATFVTKAQNVDYYIFEAEKQMLGGNYFKALEEYRKAYSLDTNRIDILSQLAMVSMEYNLYRDAQSWLTLLCRRDTVFANSRGYFHLGQMQKSNGDYNGALLSFNRSIAGSTNDSIRALSKHKALSIEKALEILANPRNVQLHRLDRIINSPYSEFGALPVSSNRIYFTAVKPVSQGDYNNMFPEFASIWRSVIYSSRISIAGYTRPEPLPHSINKRGTNNGSISKVPGKRAFYFVRCKGDISDESNCRIFHVELSGNKWKKPRPLPSHINLAGYSALHPQMVRHGDTWALYFVSDRPGGYGGKDIWYSLYTNGQYGQPVNLGSTVNTTGNEVTPYFVEETSVLFFASDAHHGLGGYDIFSSKGGLNTWEHPVNLGVPFNSGSNDLYFFLNPSDSSGYFTSNRPAPWNAGSTTCCGDIFYFEWQREEVAVEETPESPEVPTPETRIRALLPLSLYFDNDQPDPRSSDSITSRNYRETLVEYLEMKDKYRVEYGRGLKGDEKSRAESDILAFFENYVESGYGKLEQITQWLLEDLNQGYSVRLYISGYASPLNNPQYNLTLSKRRINSFVNYLRQYRDGLLLPFLDGTAANKAQLRIVENPQGDSKALAFVSNNPNDKRNSVYSRSAAFERRIEIIAYESDRPEPQALLRWETATIDLGKVAMDQRLTKTVKIVNHGNAAARLQFVTPGCDCLTVEFQPEAEILPGGFVEIKVTFNPHGQYPGPYHEILSAGFYGIDDYIVVNIAAFILE